MKGISMFFLGLLIGGTLGFCCAALCRVAHDADDWSDWEQL